MRKHRHSAKERKKGRKIYDNFPRKCPPLSLIPSFCTQKYLPSISHSLSLSLSLSLLVMRYFSSFDMEAPPGIRTLCQTLSVTILIVQITHSYTYLPILSNLTCTHTHILSQYMNSSSLHFHNISSETETHFLILNSVFCFRL